MEKVDVLIRALEPEIDEKCAQIRQKKSEKLLTKIFAAAVVLVLTVPASLMFFGISVFAVLAPVEFMGTVMLTAADFCKVTKTRMQCSVL